jgi:hypothetical protein
LSVTASAAERLPLAAGVNMMLTVQLEFAASELPQVLVCEKSLALVPSTAMLEIVIAALPEFFSETV